MIFLKNRECFIFKLLFLSNGRVYLFNKFFTLVFFKQSLRTSFLQKFLVNFLSNLLLLNNGKFYSFEKVFPLVFCNKSLVNFQSIFSLILSIYLTLFFSYCFKKLWMLFCETIIFKEYQILFIKQSFHTCLFLTKSSKQSLLHSLSLTKSSHQFFNTFLVNFKSNLLLLNNGKVYSFNKALTQAFFNKFLVNCQSIFSRILCNCSTLF